MPTDVNRLWKRLLLRVWRRTEDDRDLADEIRFHLAEEERLRVEAGVPAGDARASARRDFGNVARVTEITRGVRGWTFLETFVQDVRFSVRLLRRNRVFTLFSIGSLALGIGATSAIFSLFNAIVLRELPVREPDRLVSLSFAMGAGRPNNYMPYPHFAQMRDANSTLEGLFAWARTPRISLGFQGREEIVSMVRAGGDYYPTLGVQPALGRLLGRDDDHPGTAVAVISYGYWQRRFAGSASVIGAGISLNRLPFTIIGVEPRGFAGVNVGESPDVTVPLQSGERVDLSKGIWVDPFATWIEIMGRLRPGVSREQAAEDLKLIFSQVNASAATAAPENAFAARVVREARLIVEPGTRGGQSSLRAGYERWLLLLLLMLAAVVLLASLNVATLLLARSEARKVEIATRLAIGAGRWRIVRQLMTDALLIAGFSGALGLLLAWWASQFLLRVALVTADTLPIDLTPDLRVFAFTTLVSAMTCVLFGLMPALRATAIARHAGGREQGAPRRRLLERTLVATQTALSLVLLVLAALFIRSLHNLWQQDPGYDRANILMFSVDAGLAGKRDAEGVRTYQSVLDELRVLPGVTTASASTVAPVSTTYYFASSIEKVGTTEFPANQLRFAFNSIAPGYFATLRIPLLAGRDFDFRDTVSSPKVGIISERLAARFTGNPIGQLVVTSDGSFEVVGVAKDSRYARVKDAPRDVVYLPMFQSSRIGVGPTFEIRYAGPVSDMVRSVRQAVAGVDASLTLFQVTTLEARTRDSLARERLLALLSSYVGGFAVLLACIGLYGLLMYSVVQRTPELGLRMALGSQAAAIRRIVLKDSVATVVAGAVAGLGAAWVLVRLVKTQLFALEPTDPVAFGAATLVLLSIAAAAAYVPAWRASRIDPVIALRRE